MELWVRSQDREKFMKVDYFYLYQNSIIGYSQSTFTSPVLGKYKRKERALEVLDEIQSLIDFMVCKEIFTYDSEEFMQLTYNQIQHIKENGCIYEMPKE